MRVDSVKPQSGTALLDAVGGLRLAILNRIRRVKKKNNNRILHG